MANSQEQQAIDDRKRILQQGDKLQSDVGGDIGRYQGAYGSGYNQTEDALAKLGANPGYTPQESQAIIRQQQLEGLQNGSDQNANFLTADEYSGVAGNPFAAMQAYNPGAISDAANRADANTRGVVGQTGGQLQQGVTRTGQKLDASVNPSKLELSGGYTSGVSNVLNKTAADVKGATDPAKLGISGDYSKALNFGDKDVQDIENAAGTTEGNRFANEEQQLRQKAIEQGNTSPAAIASAMERLNIQEGSAAGDAMTDARIKAKQAQMGAAQSKEATRLGSEQYIAGQGEQGAQYLGNLAANEVGQQEQMRLGTEQDIASRQAQNATTEGQLGQQATEFTGQQGLQNENAVGARDIGVEQQNQLTGQNLLGTGEAAQAGRAATLAGNRQATEQGNQANQFNRGVQVQDQLSANNATVANARRTGEAGYLAGQQHQEDQAQTGATTARGQQIGAYGSENSGANQATSTGLQASQKPGIFDKIVGTAVGAAGALGGLGGSKGVKGLAEGGVAGVQGPEVKLVGEAGPEMVIPRYGKGGLVTKPTIAVLGENGPEEVIPFNRNKFTKLGIGSKIPSQGYRAHHPTAAIGPLGPVGHTDPLKILSSRI